MSTRRVLTAFAAFSFSAGRRLMHRSTVHQTVAVTHSFEPAGSDAHGRPAAWLPNQGCGRSAVPVRRRGLPGGATAGSSCGQLESTKASIEGLLAGEDVIDDRTEFLRDQRARDRFALPPNELLVLSVDLGVVLRRAHGGVVERDLEIAIPVQRRLVASARRGVLGARHEATIGMKPRTVGNRWMSSISSSNV